MRRVLRLQRGASLPLLNNDGSEVQRSCWQFGLQWGVWAYRQTERAGGLRLRDDVLAFAEVFATTDVGHEPSSRLIVPRERGGLGLVFVTACGHCKTFSWGTPVVWGAAKEGWPMNPPFPTVFLLLQLRRHPKTLNTNTAPSMRLLWGTLGPGLVMPNFGVFLETPFLARTPLATPFLGHEGGFLGGFLGRSPPLPRPLPGQEPPFLNPSYDPSCPEAIAHKSVRWGLNGIVPPH